MTQNRDCTEEQRTIEPDLTGYTREGAHARMQPNAGQDEPQKVASKARESLAYLKPEKAYTPTTIKDLLEADDMEIGPRKRDLGEVIRAAYPKAVNKAGSKRQRRWTGVGAKPEPRTRTEPPDGNSKTAINKPATEASEAGNKWECQLEASDWQKGRNDLRQVVYVLDFSEQGWHRLGDLTSQSPPTNTLGESL